MRYPVKFLKVHPDAILPEFQRRKDSGFDLHCVEDVTIEYGKVTLIKTGLKMELPRNFPIVDGKNMIYDLTPELQVRPRGGFALKHGMTIVNTPGTVDNGFRGEICILATKLTPGEVKFEKGTRVAQGVIGLVMSNDLVDPVWVNELSETERNEGMLTSTGTK